ncbi:IS630 family transposase [Xenorhabdus bovienii]|uniref:IS630 family transposase n=4 Tax=Xenorhabdus bovienii TaxID=40576 RepID=A0AAJ1JGT2_XENBV|nr:IS630 family transposase [Xenorhabdus bovienii]MDE1480733.1 IS630 family transposase [Xenorhabdus bovienii]MDE9512474.1 IS630 family transposase [Xenorhabdus bovienii]MDE9524109.1 IS630 family transposase [Xenorhabdus bovienii]
MLDKIKAGAQSGRYRLVYFDEAGFAASPPVQYGWSPRGKPPETEPQNHCRRSVLGALNYTDNSLFYQTVSGHITRANVIDFLAQVAKQGDNCLTFLVLDNARIHLGIETKIKVEWLREHNMFLLYLPAYSPELNLIEIVWKQAKYHWRRFITWTKETMEEELNTLLGGYGNKFAINFS